MLARAARNTYSWWWASHIRTKQSKWLEENLQDMEEKVEYILKIITEDGDSFRLRAEQYYKKRPEIVNFVEDTFRGYRALAERYDHLSRDLQSANRTIAIIFPERVQMSFDEEEYKDLGSNFTENENKLPANSHVPLSLPLPPKQPKMESVVQAMLKKKSKMPTKMMAKKGLIKIGVEENAFKVSKSSRLSESEAIEEIDKLQKEILGFQTEKEFVKSSYDNALSKYWEIDNNINEMHTKISNMRHEFMVGGVMEDKDAQTLISSSALKMCKKTLTKLKCTQTRYKKEAIVEHRRVDEIRKKFEDLIAQNNDNSDLKNVKQTIEHVKDKKEKTEEQQMKFFEENGMLIEKEHVDNSNIVHSDGNDKEGSIEGQTTRKFEQEKIIGKNEEITITKVAEKIEQLVDKIIILETEVIHQIALMMRLKLENDELVFNLERLQQDNKNLGDESNNMNIKIKRLEEQLKRVHILDEKIKGENVLLETSFDEASVNIDNLSNDLLIAKPDENAQEDDMNSQLEKEKTPKFPKVEEANGFESYKIHHPNEEGPINDSEDLEVLVKKYKEQDEIEEDERPTLPEAMMNKEQDVNDNGEEDELNWKLVSSHRIEDREKMLLEEYKSTLRNFKELKKKLNEKENKSRASSFRYVVQMKMLRNLNESKDAKIRSLHEKLRLLETNIEKPKDFQLQNGPYLVDEEIEGRTRFDENIEFKLKKDADLIEATEGRKELEDAGYEPKKDSYLTNEEIEKENDLDETTEELEKASHAIDEGTHRIKELIETAHSELKKARNLVDGGTKERKELDVSKDDEQVNSTNLVDEGTQEGIHLDEIYNYEQEKAPNLVNEGIQRSKDLDEIADFEQKKALDLVDEEKQNIKEIDETIDVELKKDPYSINEATQRIKNLGDDVDEAHEVLDVEEAIHTQIEDFRKENLELWLRFSTSYHQINRFQDAFHDLLQEIKQVKEKKNEHGKQHHHHHHSNSFASDIRPLHRHLLDMQTEVILWLEKSGILEDDLEHRLTSLSNIQDELSDLSNNVSNSKKTTTPLNSYQAAKFQGEVLNMKQENAKVLDELREASERVKTLQFDIEKTLSKLDEELGKMKKSNSSSKVPFRSFLFGAKLKKKRRSSLFTCMSPSLQRQYSDLQVLPQPREET